MKWLTKQKPTSILVKHEPKILVCLQCEKEIMEYIIIPLGEDQTTLEVKCSCGAEFPKVINGDLRIISDGISFDYERTNHVLEENKIGIMRIEVLDE